MFVNEVFFETLLHKEEYLIASNVDMHIQWIKPRIDFMAQWKSNVNARRDNPPVDADRQPPISTQFIAPETWINMRMCITGWFEFAKYFLNNVNVKAMFPMLFITSSCIEVVFS